MIASVDQPIAYAGGAHFAEGDLLRAVHVLMKRDNSVLATQFNSAQTIRCRA